MFRKTAESIRKSSALFVPTELSGKRMVATHDLQLLAQLTSAENSTRLEEPAHLSNFF